MYFIYTNYRIWLVSGLLAVNNFKWRKYFRCGGCRMFNINIILALNVKTYLVGIMNLAVICRNKMSAYSNRVIN